MKKAKSSNKVEKIRTDLESITGESTAVDNKVSSELGISDQELSDLIGITDPQSDKAASNTDLITNLDTETILNNKADDVLYLGIDLKDKSYLNNPAKNIYTLQTKSENTDEIISYLNSLGKTQIDFLFIDGFHSVNQVYLDWELTCILSPNGVVGFHDTAYHPGPHLFVKNMDRSKWKVSENCCNHTPDDYGIGFAWKISD